MSTGRIRLIISCCFVGPLLAVPRQGVADDPDSPIQIWVKERHADLRSYRFERNQPEPVDLALQPESLLNWTNAERDTNKGALFLWTHKGRPQMIACAYELGGILRYEFHSLSTDPIVAHHDGSVMHRFGPGLEWTELPRAPERARTRPLRLVQLRRQAERFVVSTGLRDWTQTRLLPQPVFRSPESASDDLTIFVFVQGTDPECVLLLDATEKDGWKFALTRQTKWGLKAQLDGRLIWERAPNHQPENTPETPFLVIKRESQTNDADSVPRN